jgi:hypothetical protein
MKDTPCSRRSFLAGSLLLVGATTGTTPASTEAWIPELGERITSWRLSGLFEDPHSAGVVGRRYLEERSGQVDTSSLLDEVLPRGIRARPEAEIRTLLAARIREDFANRTTVEVGGWVLSETEARLCALVALASHPA